MNWWTYIVAWLLPLATGTAAYLAVSPRRVAGWRWSAAGYGFLLGMLLAAIATSIVAYSDTSRATVNAGLCLLAAFALAAAMAWRRRDEGGVIAVAGATVLATWQRAVIGGLLASLLLRAAIAAREIWLRPLYPWDAWSAWAMKPKAWVLLGHYVPFVSLPDWLRAAGDTYTEIAWHYPDTLAWLEVWMASGAGGWVEPLINLLWLGLWIALLAGHYGQWRALGLSRARAWVFVYALGSLPLLSVHTALAGYMDMWVSAAFGFGVLSWMRWLRDRERSQLALALVCAAALPWLKMEGWVWTICLLAAIAFGTLPLRLRRTMAIAGTLLFIVLFPLGGLHFLCVHAGVINPDGSIAMPAIGPLALVLNLKWQPGALKGAIHTLFAQPNWHLLWWLTPAVVAWRWRELVTHDWLRLPAALLLVCATLLLILFLFTEASVWAQSFTAINRLVLQLVPAWMTVLVMLLRDVHWSGAERDTVPSSGLRSDPA